MPILIMNDIYLPFQIGEQYENWEFDLDYLNEEKIKGFDSYLYLWQRAFLYLVSSRIELIFALDILEVVIIRFEFYSLEEIEQFKQILEQKFERKSQFKNEQITAEIYSLLGDLELWLVENAVGLTTKIAYGKGKYLRIIYY